MTRGLPYRVPLLAGLIAVVIAAVLVVHLQYQSALEHERRTAVIIRQVCERSAGVLAGRLRELFGGAVVHTIESIGHRELKAYNLARIDRSFGAGVKEHAYVNRFFMWHERLPRHLRDEVLFYRSADEPGPRDLALTANGERGGGFFRDRGRGEQLWRSARNMLSMGKGFGIEETLLDGVPHQVIYHFFWDNGQRNRLFAAIGFIVNLDELRHGGRFNEIVTRGLEPLLNPRPDVVGLTLRVEDETGRGVLGPPTLSSVAGSESFDLLFFPRTELGHYVVQMPPVPRWRLTVSPTDEMPVTNGIGFWVLAGIVLLLLLVAVVCAVHVNRQAIRLSELQSDFVANVSHQLRTPLAMLSGAAETLGLERVRSPAKVKEYADIVQAQTQRLSVLVDQILHFHRAEFAGRVPVRQKVDLCALTTLAAAQVQELGNAPGVTMCVECDAPGLVVRGDPVALEFAVVNLLENAVKYSGGAGNEVTVSVSASRGYGVITVRDRGIGIEHADMPHIFEKFYRGRGESQSRRGFGLGLAIVRSTVMVHGGRIAVTSEPGRGSEFTVSLPLSA